MKQFIVRSLMVIFVSMFAMGSVSSVMAQTGAPPGGGQGQGPRPCINSFQPGIAVDPLDALLFAPLGVNPIQNAGIIAELYSDLNTFEIVSLIDLVLDLNVNDIRNDLCIFFDFDNFDDDATGVYRIVRAEQIEQVVFDELVANEVTECELPNDLVEENATFRLDIYQQTVSSQLPIDVEDDILVDFEETPILVITNILNPLEFEINLIFCDESPEDDPETAEFESLEPPEFENVPTLEVYCEEAAEELEESDDPLAELPKICDELIRSPQNQAIFVITDTDGYFNYSVDR